MAPTSLHLRSETKKLERRSALTPTTILALVKADFTVNVERSTTRMFLDEEFAAAGAILVPEGSWPGVPKDHIIIGLKELPKDDFPLIHTHIQFGHCYKGQEGWADYLDRFVRGDGLLYDIEFLTDDSGRRVAAFGYYAGYAGAAVALLAWAHQVRKPGTPCPSIPAYPSEKTLVSNVKWAVKAAVLLNNGQQPQVHIIGALGRCGRGAIDLCNQVGIADSDVIEWDIAETRRGGPFAEIAEADVFVNCVYLTEPIRPFVTRESLSRSRSARKLRVVCDVSCDLTDPKNPVPLYTTPTTFTNPTSPVNGLLDDGPELTIIAIDHLPSLVAREASDVFSKQLLPSLKSLDRRGEGVWLRAEKMFREHVSTIPQNT